MEGGSLTSAHSTLHDAIRDFTTGMSREQDQIKFNVTDMK